MSASEMASACASVVDGNELNAANALLDHAVDGVGAAATHAHDLDDGKVVAEGIRVLNHRFLLVWRM